MCDRHPINHPQSYIMVDYQGMQDLDGLMIIRV
jgi:hypothetical protein